MYNLDIALFRAINGLVGQADWLDIAGFFCATYLIHVLIALVIIQVWATSWRREAVRPASFWQRLKGVLVGPLVNAKDVGPLVAFRAALAGALAWSVNQIFTVVLFRPRPYAVLEGVQRLIDEPAGHKSFPSDHTTLAFALAFSVALSRPDFGVLLLILAVMIALGRVFVGVHYPSDVVAGIMIGLLWALVIRRLVSIAFFTKLTARFRRRPAANG